MTFRSLWRRHSAVANVKPVAGLFLIEQTGAVLDAIGRTVGISRAIWISVSDLSEAPQTDDHYKQDIVERILDLTWRTALQPGLLIRAITDIVGIDWNTINHDVAATHEQIILTCNSWKRHAKKNRSPRAAKMEADRNDTIRRAWASASSAGITILIPNSGFVLPPTCRVCGILHKVPVSSACSY